MDNTPASDLIVHNARLFGHDPEHTAVAVSGNEISAIGTDHDILVRRGADTRVIDAKDGFLMPGFYESHMHLFEGGASLQRLNVASVFGQEMLNTAVRDYAVKHPDDALLISFGANYTMLGESRRISRNELDAALPDRPFIIIATDFHTAWANTVALERAGILQGRDLGPTAEIVMGEDGLATGELREHNAMDCVLSLRSSGGRESLGMAGEEPDTVTDLEREEDMKTLLAGLEHCARHGITKIINMDGNRYQLELLAEIERRGTLPCRIEVPYRIPVELDHDPIAKAIEMTSNFNSGKVSCGRVKLFMDGVFDSWTAVVVDEYPDQPGFAGEPIVPQELFDNLCIRADAAGLQISVHAVGDGAVRMVLNGYEAARKANGPRDSRHRIEHIDTIDERDLPRLSELGVVASMQPVHPPGSAGLPLEPTTTLMGRARWPLAFNWRAIADTGVTIAFGTDWPVSPLDPLYCIQCAMTREKWAEELPDPRLTLDECLTAYTVHGAYAAFDEDRLGRIAPGMLADLVLLQGDIDSLSRKGDLQVRAALTVCDGQITHESLQEQT